MRNVLKKQGAGFMKFSVKYKIIFLILLGLIVLLTPIMFRYFYHDNLLIGEESYYNLRLASFVNENHVLPVNDDLSYGGRSIVDELGWIVLLALNPELMSRLLPIALGLFSLVLFFLIAKMINQRIAVVSTILFILSPGFMYIFSVSTKYSMAILLGLLGFYFVLRKKYFYGILFLSFVSFFSFLGSIASLFLFLILSFYKRYNKKYCLFGIFLSFLFMIIQYSRLYSLKLPGFTLFYLREEGINYFFQNIISDFGGLYGFGFVTLILSLIGINALWKKKYKFLLIYIVIFLFLVLTSYLSFISFYLTVFISLLGGYGFITIQDSKWESSLVKNITIFIIICAVIFSSVSYMDRLVSLQPTKEVYDAIYYLDRKPAEDVVFSSYKRGLWINYGGKKNIIDSHFFYAPDARERFSDSNILFNTQDLDIAFNLINKYNINYIWIDKLMKEDIWDNEEKDLLFLLNHSERFKKVFDNGYVEIWRVKG